MASSERSLRAIAWVTTGLLVGISLFAAGAGSTYRFAFLFLGALLCGREAFGRRSVGWGAAAGVLFALTVGTHLDWQPVLGALERFYLNQWRQSVESRLGHLDQLYSVVNADINNRRMVWLEVLVVIFFAIDLLLLFWKR